MTQRTVAGNLDGPGFVWLAVEAPSPEEIADVRERYGIAGDVLREPGRTPRPSLFEESSYSVVTLAGAAAAGADLAEVRCFVSRDWMITVHDDVCPPVSSVSAESADAAAALEALASALVTGLIGVVRDLETAVETIEDGSGGDPGPIRRRLVALRSVVLSQRDVLARLGRGEGLPAPAHPRTRGLRNSAERMGEIGSEIETLREALHDAATDRQNDVVRRLTALAAIFLPLTFITGFFGQNFGWMVDHVGGAGSFLVLGLVLPVVTVAALLLFFRGRGWL